MVSVKSRGRDEKMSVKSRDGVSVAQYLLYKAIALSSHLPPPCNGLACSSLVLLLVPDSSNPSRSYLPTTCKTSWL